MRLHFRMRIPYMTIYTAGTIFALISMGMKLFYYRTGLPSSGNAHHADRSGDQYCPGSGVHFPSGYGCGGRCGGNRDRADVFLRVCAVHSEKKENAGAAWGCEAGTVGRKADRKDRIFAVSDLRHRQYHHYCAECGAAALRRIRVRRYAGDRGDHCSELYAADHFPHAGHHGRIPASDQLQLRGQ